MAHDEDPIDGGRSGGPSSSGPIPLPSSRPIVPTGHDTLRIIREDPETAVGRLRARIFSGAADYRTWHNLAVALNNRGDRERAIDAAKTAIEKSPGSAISHLLLGILLRDSDRFDEALVAFREVEALDREFPRLHANRGVVYFFRGESDRAAEALEAAIRRDPGDRLSMFNLAVVEVARKRFPAAQSCFERLARLEPERASFYHQFLVELGRVQVVEETLSQAHRIKNFLGIVGDRLRRFADRIEDDLGEATRHELAEIRDDQERIYSDMVVFLGAIQPRPMRLESIDLSALIERIVFVASTAGNGVRIRRSYEDGLAPIQCDVDMVQEAFLNVLLNAIDAVLAVDADEGAALEVGIEVRSQEPPTEGVIVEFRDRGVGIPPERLERIFQFGFTTKPLGSGIGLAHTRRIIGDHGGAICVESVVGEGTVVRCSLPRNPSVCENLVNLSIRSQLLIEPQGLILEEGGQDMGI
ncbi:MAG: tetratricopeptide repeat protein [Planctomycetes bacterium]|nr:tetratricopeptide repeat protein [Planctomycetota bacterium]